MTKLSPKLYPLLVFLLGVVFLIPFLGYFPLFDTAEIQSAEAAREMLVTNVYRFTQLDFQPSYVPPLMPWLQALSMRVFGVADKAELAARLPNALMGIVTMLTLFYAGCKKHDAQFGLLWAVSYLGSIAPLMLAKSALPATTGHLFTFLGTLLFINTVTQLQSRKRLNFLLSGLLFSLGLYTSSNIIPQLLLIAVLLLSYLGVERQPISVTVLNSLLVITLPILCVLAWYWLTPGSEWRFMLIPGTSTRYLFGQFYLQGLGVISILPVVILAARYWSIDKSTPITPEITYLRWIGVLVPITFVTFIFSPPDVLLGWFPLSYLATYHIYQFLQGQTRWDNLNGYLLIVSNVLVGLVMIAIPLAGMHPDWLAQQFSDPFWLGVAEAPVNWDGWEWLIGVTLIVFTVGFVLGIRRWRLLSFIGLYLSTGLCTLAFWAIILPKIEQYVQGPLIDFCEAKWNQPVYVQPTFPSYAHLFYTRKKPPIRPDSRQISWLVNGTIDKPAFIISRATDADLYRYKNTLELVSEESGYVVFKRKQYR